MLNECYVYVLCRRDISPIMAVVQVAHATLESGQLFCDREKHYPINLVVLGVDNEHELISKSVDLEKNMEIKHKTFFEPDNDLGFTALATEPIHSLSIKREWFKQFKLLKLHRNPVDFVFP